MRTIIMFLLGLSSLGIGLGILTQYEPSGSRYAIGWTLVAISYALTWVSIDMRK